MAITGTDTLSMDITKSLENGTTVKDIPSRFPVSLDQAKRLSRFRNILKKANMHLSADTIEKIHLLGLKALVLSPLFKSNDWDGIGEILNSDLDRPQLNLSTLSQDQRNTLESNYEEKYLL